MIWRLALLCGALWTAPVLALSLGEAQLRTGLGQRLDLIVPVDDVGSGPLYSSVRAVDAGTAIPKPGEGDAANFVANVEHGAAGVQVRIVSLKPVLEPVLQLQVTVRQGEITLNRQVNVLLDLPTGTIAATPTPEPALVVSRSIQPAAAQKSPSTPAPSVAPIKPATPSTRAAPTLSTTPIQSAAVRPRPQMTDPLHVRRGDTLSNIAERTPRPAGQSHARFVQALLLANPAAFDRPGDPRTLRAGVTLQMPSAKDWAAAAEEPLTSPPALSAPTETAARGHRIGSDLQTIYLRPGLLGLELALHSWQTEQDRLQAGVRSLQKTEPARFRADWTLGGAQHVAIAPTPTAVATTAATSATPAPTARPEPTMPRTTPESIPEADTQPAARASLEAGDAWLDDQTAPSAATPDSAAERAAIPVTTPLAAITITPAPTTPDAADDGGWHWWLLILLIVGLGLWRLWQRQREAPGPDLRWTPDEAESAPATAAAAAGEPAESGAPALGTVDDEDEDLNPAARDLLQRIQALRENSALDDAARNELKVAEMLTRRDRLDAGAEIVARYEDLRI